MILDILDVTSRRGFGARISSPALDEVSQHQAIRWETFSDFMLARAVTPPLLTLVLHIMIVAPPCLGVGRAD